MWVLGYGEARFDCGLHNNLLEIRILRNLLQFNWMEDDWDILCNYGRNIYIYGDGWQDLSRERLSF